MLNFAEKSEIAARQDQGWTAEQIIEEGGWDADEHDDVRAFYASRVDDADLTYAERVRRGIELLDAEGPAGWRDRVNLDELHMLTNCVLDQVYYPEMTDEDREHVSGYGYAIMTLPRLGVNGSAYGFGMEKEDPANALNELRIEWIRQLRS